MSNTRFMQKFKAWATIVIFSLPLFPLKAQVTVSKIPDWVINQSFENEVNLEGDESGFVYLLSNEQENYNTKHLFSEYAYKVLNSEGIQSMSDLYISFDPSYEKIQFHFLNIIRENEKINQLPNTFNIIQRETSADRYLYDGSQTILINLKDVRTGDIIHYSYSRIGYNPIFSKHIVRNYSLQYATPIGKIYNRIILPEQLKVYWKNEHTAIKPEKSILKNEVSYSWQLKNVKPILFDNNEPEWYDVTPRLIISSFQTWNEVIDWALPYYKVADQSKYKIKNLLEKEIEGYDTEEFINWSVNFVQDEIRYLGFENGLNAYQPHDPIKVFNQRFGDCKDKSLLLVTLLQTKNIEAFPVLVNSSLRQEVKNKQASFYAFDHCIVGIKSGNEIYFIDPTLNNQGGSWKNKYLPKYGYGLPISELFLDLIPIHNKNAGKIIEKHQIEITGLEGEATMTVQTVFSGNEADYQRSYFLSNSKEKILKQYLNFYGNLYPQITKFDELNWKDDRDKNIFIVNENYKIPNFWKKKDGEETIIYCEFYPITLESYFNVNKTSSKNSPYRISYPVEYEHTIDVTLHDTWNIPPTALKIENDFYQYSYKVDYDEAYKLTLKTNYKTLTDAIPTEHLQTFINDHTQMMDNLSYKLQFNQTVQNSIDNNYVGLFVTMLILVIGGVGIFYLYTQYDPIPFSTSISKQLSIGGWLVLVGFGVCITPLRLLFQFYSDPSLIDGKIWYSQFLVGEYGLGFFVLTEQIYNLLYFLLSSLLVLLFIQRRTSFPRLMIINLATHAIFVNIDNALAITFNPASEWDTRHTIQALIQASIWIPYFIYSDRVKETFLTRYHS